jgi:hypothetical protein
MNILTHLIHIEIIPIHPIRILSLHSKIEINTPKNN